MASVFLSYSREDVARAQAVATALERLGHTVWWDRQVHGGSRFSQEIEHALKRSDAIVVLWSQASSQSAWVQDEAAEGRDSGRLVAAMIDDSKPPLGFRQYQAVDLSGWKGRANAPAITAVHEAILAKSGISEKRDVQRAPPERRSYRRVGIVASSLLAVIVAGLLYWFAGPARQSDGDALRLRLGEFAALSQAVPREMPDTFREEILSALATDAVIIATVERSAGRSDAGYALTATIRNFGDVLRFTVHLVNEGSGATVWTETLERPAAIADIAPRQVAVAVSQVLRCGLGGTARYGKPLPDETLSIFLNYCEEYWADTAGKVMNATRALDLARRVVAAAPDFSHGWSGLAQVAGMAAVDNEMLDQEALRGESARAAERALELDKDNSEAYQALASLQPPFAFAAREKFHLESITVRPSDCGCEYVGYGGFLYRVGRTAEAVEALKRAHDMIPLSADVNASFAEALLVTGRTREADDIVAGVFELWPDYVHLRGILLRTAFWTGRYDDAAKALADPNPPVPDDLRPALSAALNALRSGNAASKASAVGTLRGVRPNWPEGAFIVTALAALGAQQEALALAERLVRRNPRALALLFESPLASARHSPQFEQLAQRFGLIGYWRETRHLPDFCKESSPPQLCARL